jgi:nucleoid DNA-binding protein
MKREKLTQAVARQTRVGRAAARDQVDEMVHKILRALRRGEPVDLPGLGKLVAPAKTRRATR